MTEDLAKLRAENERATAELFQHADYFAALMHDAYNRGDTEAHNKYMDILTGIFRCLCRCGHTPFLTRSKWQ
jgi:hypothetical protein